MRSIKRWVFATFILTFLVIIAGAVVRTTQSGMGCPDWPKCFGRWIPPTNASQLPPDFEKYLHKQDIDHTFNPFHTWIEYINRLFATLLGIFAIVQFLLIYRKKQLLKISYKLSLIFLALVIIVGLFGAIVVKYNLAHLSISVHLLLAIAMTQVELALLLSLKEKLSSIKVDRNFRKMMIAFLVILLIQSSLGTMVRMYVDDISKILHYEHRENWLAAMPTAFLIHRTFSWIVLISAVYLTWKYRNVAAINRKLHLLLTIVLLNMITGIILFYADIPAVAQPIHVLLASLAITQLINILLQTTNKHGFLNTGHV
ncbi:MAG: COX15/CtaA family protein [Ferruginibacter sp.]